jgi:hypothetical protein
MPDAKRADVAVIYNGMGVPVEIKGQWHKKMWDAPSEQLIELYTKDYRANGRGIYLVLWFGPAAGKNLVSHPDGKLRPGTPEELRQMLLDRLDPVDPARRGLSRQVPDPDISMVHKFADKPVDFAASSSPRHAEIRRVLSVAQFAGGLEIAREADSVVIAPSAPHGDNA